MPASPSKRRRSPLGINPQGIFPHKKFKLRRRSRSIDSLSNSDEGLSEEKGHTARTTPRKTHRHASIKSEVYACASWTPKVSRARSLSIDSAPDSILSSSSSPPNHPQNSRQILDGVPISPGHSIAPDSIYLSFHNEIIETPDLFVPGEARSSCGGRPVRFLDCFTIYDEDGVYLPFSAVAAALLSTNFRLIYASGLVSRCLEDEEDSDSDIEDEVQPLVSLQPLNDFWTDYNARELNGIWGACTIGVATAHAWYILQQPAPLYTTYYQPFYAAHRLTCLAAKTIRRDSQISYKTFCRQMKLENDEEIIAVMGRQLVERDLTGDYVILYLHDQLSSKYSAQDSKVLLKSPLLQHFVRSASRIGQTLHQYLNMEIFDRSTSNRSKRACSEVVTKKALTITTPLVHELTTGLFLKTLLKAGEELDSHERRNKLIQTPVTPDILHPDRPTNIDWEDPIGGHPGYYSKVFLDGEPYAVGDVVMVEPGEDDVTHRAKSALEPCSLSHKNELVNRVWFCRIIHLKRASKRRGPESTAHVQWYQHGSRTILQETAHPYGLFSLAECTDIPLGSILGLCDVRHLKPGDEEPHDYHCSFLWDADEARFLDQSILKQADSPEDHLACPCCVFIQKRDRDAAHESFLHSKTYAEVRGTEYHRHDFVYVAAKPNRPYLIGQIRQFIIDESLTLENSRIELRLIGRFDDVARAARGKEVRRDETRLFMTDQIHEFSLSLLEGKCFIREKKVVVDQDLADHFYIDRKAATPNVRALEDLIPFHDSMLKVCQPCLRAVKQKQDYVQSYKACNAPLKTMELFAGAGGLSTGLEQSGFMKTCWAVEVLPGAAATFQANHPSAIVYNQDTNVCLQSAIDFRDGKPSKKLRGVGDGKLLPPMPQHDDVELITGGFPCQSFSGMNHQRHKSHEDIRTTLVANMLSYVEFYKPRFVLMENVKGLLQHNSPGVEPGSGGDGDDGDEGCGAKAVKMSIVKFVLRALLRLGYQTQFKVLQAADYGSPQRRERVIFWAARRPEPLPEYPLPTHVTPQYRPPVLSLPTYDKLSPVRRSENNCAPFQALVVADAISDLPGFDWENPHVLYPEGEEEAEEGLQRKKQKHYEEHSAVSTALRTLVGFTEPVDYASSPRTRYQRMLRSTNKQVTLHCSRSFSARVVERVWYTCSDHVKGPYDIPYELWTPAQLKMFGDEAKLNRKWQLQFSRLKWDEPFNTAMTSCRPFSKGSKVLHATQKRIITARECARSQGFPDSYQFVQMDENGGPAAWVKLLDDIHKQIGNAVPVPLAYALGKSLGEALVTQWLQKIVSERV